MSEIYEQIQQCVAYIKDAIDSRSPKVAIILGSGLNQLADILEDKITLPYGDLPGFATPTVEGHSGAMHIGKLNGTEIICMQGRVHGYEGHDEVSLGYPTRVLAALGVNLLILTNAAGSLRADMGPGSLMIITDHINFMGLNPLVGMNDDRIGPRFQDMTDAWDPTYSAQLRECADRLDIEMDEGVYVAVRGPNFETATEIRMFGLLGGSAVGMSTVPECLTARHAGMKVIGISSITNYGTGLTGEEVNHEEVIEIGAEAGKELARVLTEFIGEL